MDEQTDTASPAAALRAARWVRLDDLNPWERNARQHTDESVAKLAAGIKRFGFLVPVTVWGSKMRIAAGHGRRMALLRLLREDPSFVPSNAPAGVSPGMVPALVEEFESEPAFEAFALADNQHAKNAKDDDEQIAAILRDLAEQDWSFDGMGFDDDAIDQALQAMPELDLDDLDEEFDLAESDGMFKFFALVANEDAAEAKAAVAWWKQRQGLPKGHRTELVVGELLLHWWRENKASRAPALAAAEEVQNDDA